MANIDSHIAAIKKHLRAIEKEKQPKKEPKRYLVVEVETDDVLTLKTHSFASVKEMADILMANPRLTGPIMGLREMAWLSLGSLIDKGKIITVNEEQP